METIEKRIANVLGRLYAIGDALERIAVQTKEPTRYHHVLQVQTSVRDAIRNLEQTV